ncbi:MAG: hypothetical protein LBR15_04315 [Methanobrevibacter sp.]|jgi:hypothetical protein|nr:hypothetical protein [Candidatus Methanovirga australis]
MKFKILFKAILVIFLIANIGFIQGEQITITKNTDSDILFKEEMNTPLNQSEKNTLSSSNPLFDWLCTVNHNLTKGQAMAFTSMVSKQMNKSEQFTLELYLDYLSSSNEHPIEGINLTARELYEKSPPVKDFIDRMDDQIDKYSKLSREEACDYLLTEAPSNDVTKKILKNADFNEMNYYSNDISNLEANFEPILSNFETVGVETTSEALKKATDDFNHNISVHNMLYKMDLEDGVAPNLLQYTQNNSKLTKEFIKEIKNTIDDIKAEQIIFITFVQYAFVCLAILSGIFVFFIIALCFTLGLVAILIGLITGAIVLLTTTFLVINDFLIICDVIIANLEKVISSLEVI